MSLRNTLPPLCERIPIKQGGMETCLYRRSLMLGCAALALSPISLLGCSESEGRKRGIVSLGPLSNLKEGRTIFSIERIALFKDGGALSAMSMNCTHQSCFLRSIEDKPHGGYECPCHGSIFDSNGKVITGPAIKDLPHYGVTVTDGQILVHLER